MHHKFFCEIVCAKDATNFDALIHNTGPILDKNIGIIVDDVVNILRPTKLLALCPVT